jgi:hypothetical protein
VGVLPDAMIRTLHSAAAILALAALLASVAGSCLCAMPPAASATHECCAGGPAPALTASTDCCLSRTTADTPVVVAPAVHALPPQPAVLPLPWLDAPAVRPTSPAAGLASTPPSILRI